MVANSPLTGLSIHWCSTPRYISSLHPAYIIHSLIPSPIGKMRSSILLLISTAFLTNLTAAWGTTAHETIAQLALRYLLPETVEWLKELLPEKDIDTGMTFISTWPDGYACQCADGLWSKGLHFIDALDVTTEATKNPPLMCSVDIERDCGDGYCVVGAIKNYVCTPSQLIIFIAHLSFLSDYIDLYNPTTVLKSKYRLCTKGQFWRDERHPTTRP